MRNAYRILISNPEVKRPHVKHRRTWDDDIKMDLKETGCGLESRGSEQSGSDGLR
jgi:hypothetical protein